MALPINACIRLSSSPPPPPLPNASPPPLSQWSGWRRNTLAAAAAAMVTIGTVSAMEGPIVLAAETGRAVAAPAAERWSEKRKCPSWHANSLENIMPENLPRPPPHRRSDGLAAYRDAPALGGGAQLHGYSSGCYSL
ncbi:uncharacterized protein LOC110100678 [Dendrobium catenatum]|uniref:Uncharacterized protein n=1 Tax=Dendrobium catenatum TaxID=906689 RepID=A0A2I0WJ69_9ASPA|nr:uncharacterized protein LOC110100678 [Dendrobium catenatum]PKU75709.1 hypothetical protein MA16_Dca015589 [Dendrobium catenatum]